MGIIYIIKLKIVIIRLHNNMGSLNRAELIGTLGRDPEVRNFEGGSKVASFPLATNEPAYTLQNGTQVPEQTDWHNIVCWGSLARIAEGYLHKGQQVYVAGKLKTRSYDDRQGAEKVRNGGCGHGACAAGRPKTRPTEPAKRAGWYKCPANDRKRNSGHDRGQFGG